MFIEVNVILTDSKAKEMGIDGEEWASPMIINTKFIEAIRQVYDNDKERIEEETLIYFTGSGPMAVEYRYEDLQRILLGHVD